MAHIPTFPATLFTEGNLHCFSTEASDLRLPPGEFPRQFKIEGMGNQQPFEFVTDEGHAVTYKQALGCLTAKIWND